MPGKRSALRTLKLLISCEHAGNHVPARYRAHVPAGLLATHRGYDIGALAVARDFAAALRAPLFYATVSRLVVDLNRSEWNPEVFSPATPRAEQSAILERYYLPYRKALESEVRAALRRGQTVVHLSCHSFTPRLNGAARDADVGLLYDPRQAREGRLCAQWQKRLRRLGLRARRNYPYRGDADGLTTHLRGKFGLAYLGIELEVNQKYPRGSPQTWRALRRLLVASFVATLAGGDVKLKAHALLGRRQAGGGDLLPRAVRFRGGEPGI